MTLLFTKNSKHSIYKLRFPKNSFISYTDVGTVMNVSKLEHIRLLSDLLNMMHFWHINVISLKIEPVVPF